MGDRTEMSIISKRLLIPLAGAAMLLTTGLLGVIPAAAAQGAPAASTAGLAASTAGPAASTAASAAHAAVMEVPKSIYSDCRATYVCFYTGAKGTGSMCAWSGNDPDWTTAPGVCSWATTHNVFSVYNHGTSPNFTGVVYYLQTHNRSRIGCTPQGRQGNLAGTYQLRSHQWTTGHCG